MAAAAVQHAAAAAAAADGGGPPAAAAAGPPRVDRAARLAAQATSFSVDGAVCYDAVVWRTLKWPTLSMAWLPSATWQPPPGVAAAQAAALRRRRAEHDAALAALRRRQPGGAGQQALQLAPMPTTFRHLILGQQTSGGGAAQLLLYRAELAGAPDAGGGARPVLMQEGELLRVLAIDHGGLDVNRLAVAPDDPNVLATASDAPEASWAQGCQAGAPHARARARPAASLLRNARRLLAAASTGVHV